MTYDQIYRALALFERYVAVQETNSRISIELAAARERRDERAVSAQELSAKSMGDLKITGDIKGNVRNHVTHEPPCTSFSESEVKP